MTAMGVPVPPGFVISTEVCAKFSKTGKFPPGLKEEVEKNLLRLEKLTGKVFGDGENPLLVSVRSGAPASMPGMMDTILNLGLTHEAKAGFGHAAGERFARDCRRRLISMYGDVVLKVPKSKFEEAIGQAKLRAGVQSDAQLSAQELRALCTRYLRSSRTPAPVSRTRAALGSDRRSSSRGTTTGPGPIEAQPHSGTWGTAVTVQAMVFGNLGGDCATGAAFTRNPATEGVLRGIPANAQGGTSWPDRTPQICASGRGDSLEEAMPAVYAQLQKVREALERNFRDMQDIEFTIERKALHPPDTTESGRASPPCGSPATSTTRSGFRRRRRPARGSGVLSSSPPSFRRARRSARWRRGVCSPRVCRPAREPRAGAPRSRPSAPSRWRSAATPSSWCGQKRRRRTSSAWRRPRES
jgi:pyruvate,orthophosphate dikinase